MTKVCSVSVWLVLSCVGLVVRVALTGFLHLYFFSLPVFAYLWTSIKQSTVYFSRLYFEPGKYEILASAIKNIFLPKGIPVSSSITLEDDSIIYAQTMPPAVQSDTEKLAPKQQKILPNDVDKTMLLAVESLKNLVLDDPSSEDSSFQTAETPSFR